MSPGDTAADARIESKTEKDAAEAKRAAALRESADHILRGRQRDLWSRVPAGECPILELELKNSVYSGSGSGQEPVDGEAPSTNGKTPPKAPEPPPRATDEPPVARRWWANVVLWVLLAAGMVVLALSFGTWILLDHHTNWRYLIPGGALLLASFIGVPFHAGRAYRRASRHRAVQEVRRLDYERSALDEPSVAMPRVEKLLERSQRQGALVILRGIQLLLLDFAFAIPLCGLAATLGLLVGGRHSDAAAAAGEAGVNAASAADVAVDALDPATSTALAAADAAASAAIGAADLAAGVAADAANPDAHLWVWGAIVCVVFELIAVVAYVVTRNRIRQLEAEIQQTDYELNLLTQHGSDQQRAERLYLKQQFELKRYNDEALRQSSTLSYIGGACIVAGFVVIGVTLGLLFSRDDVPKVEIAIVGAIGGVLANFVAAIFLGMHSGTIKAMTSFHTRLVGVNHVHIANLLVSRIGDGTYRGSKHSTAASHRIDDALGRLALAIVESSNASPSDPRSN